MRVWEKEGGGCHMWRAKQEHTPVIDLHYTNRKLISQTCLFPRQDWRILNFAPTFHINAVEERGGAVISYLCDSVGGRNGAESHICVNPRWKGSRGLWCFNNLLCMNQRTHFYRVVPAQLGLVLWDFYTVCFPQQDSIRVHLSWSSHQLFKTWMSAAPQYSGCPLVTVAIEGSAVWVWRPLVCAVQCCVPKCTRPSVHSHALYWGVALSRIAYCCGELLKAAAATFDHEITSLK